MNKLDKRFWIVAAIFVVIALVVVWGYRQSGSLYAPAEGDMTASTSADMSDATDTAALGDANTPVYTYMCDGGASVVATLHLPADDYANVRLSDGRAFILSHVIAADGARYANANESVVFWTKGANAFVTENGTTTYSGCVTNLNQ